MKEKTKQIIEAHYTNINDTNALKKIFQEVLIYYVEFHNTPTDIICEGDDSLFCSIHQFFSSEDAHNCIGCNMNESNRRIETFLLGYRLFNDEYTAFTTFIFLLYLQVEQIFEYFDIVKLPEPYKQKHFQVFYDVKRWANFLKHPKTFCLVHHPIWTYEDDKDDYSASDSPIINTKFVNRYYSGDKHNNELSKALLNKQDLKVIFPNPFSLVKRFCEAQKKFVLIIKDNLIIREMLDDKATIRDYYDSFADQDTSSNGL